MATAYPGDVPGTVTATDQHPALPGLLGFIQLAFVILHGARMLGLGIDGGRLRVSLANGSEQEKSGETNEFCHDELCQLGNLECRARKTQVITRACQAATSRFQPGKCCMLIQHGIQNINLSR